MADEGTGATVTFGTSTWTGEIVDISWNGVTRSVLDTTHLGTTTAKTFQVGDLYDAGEMTLTVNYDPDVPPPYASAAETITLAFPLKTGWSVASKLAASGFISSWDPVTSLTTDQLYQSTFTIKFSGAITQSDHT